MSRPALYFSHPACLAHDPRSWMPGHPDSPERLSAIELELARRDWLGWERRPAPPASEEELALIHDPGYIEALRDFCARGAARSMRTRLPTSSPTARPCMRPGGPVR